MSWHRGHSMIAKSCFDSVASTVSSFSYESRIEFNAFAISIIKYPVAYPIQLNMICYISILSRPLDPLGFPFENCR